VIDREGFRPNVGIIIANDQGQVLWAERLRKQGWQFPQGGVDGNESVDEAMYRELYEEVGLKPHQVKLVAKTRGWLRYRLPKQMIRKGQKPQCIGQKQKWYLLKLLDSDDAVKLNNGEHSPEFESWRWVNYWYPITEVISFKRDVYRRALKELLPHQRKLEQGNK